MPRGTPKLDEYGSVVGWAQSPPKLYLLRHPKTGKVAQVVIVADNGSNLDPQWAEANLKLLVEREPDVIHLSFTDEYDVVIV